jgi:hypothetical protein
MVRSPRFSGRSAIRSLKRFASRSLPRRNPELSSDRLSPVSRKRFRRPKPGQPSDAAAAAPVGHRIPLVAKLAFTAFMAVLVPSYVHFYGPTNFLYFCDVALFVTLAAMWLESPLLASIAAVNVLLPQIAWCADFVGGLTGHHLTGVTKYMFAGNNTALGLFKHALSLFHLWIPFLAFWLVWRLGYDRRAIAIWTLTGWAILLVCYFLMPLPPAPPDNQDLPVNINYVYAIDDTQGPQTWMPPLTWLALVMAAFPTLLWVPAHFLLMKIVGPRVDAPGANSGPKPQPAVG